MNNFFTKRKTKEENYKIIKFKRRSGDIHYTVKFKTYLLGWSTLDEFSGYETQVQDSEYESKALAKGRIENEISTAYKSMAYNDVIITEEN